MNSHKEEAKKKRFRKVKEAMSQPEIGYAFLERLVCGISQEFNTVPDDLKSEMPQLNETELAIIKSLSGSIFSTVNPKGIKKRPIHYQTGLLIGMLLEGEAFIRRQIKTPDDESEIYSMLFPALGFGDQVNDESKKKCNEAVGKLRQLYATSTALPKERFDEFNDGYSAAKTFFARQECPPEQVDDRQQLNFFVLFLGNLNKHFRSGQELEEFAKTETPLKLQNSSEATKKSLNKIHWKGSKYSRSMRSKKKVDRP